jgi:hypothetical protein
MKTISVGVFHPMSVNNVLSRTKEKNIVVAAIIFSLESVHR